MFAGQFLLLALLLLLKLGLSLALELFQLLVALLKLLLVSCAGKDGRLLLSDFGALFVYLWPKSGLFTLGVLAGTCAGVSGDLILQIHCVVSL